MSQSLLTLAKDQGLQKVDHVVLSVASADGRIKAGENVFVVDGRFDDPAHIRAHMKTDDAVRTPTAESNQQLELVNQRLAQAQSQRQQVEQQWSQQHETQAPPAMRM